MTRRENVFSTSELAAQDRWGNPELWTEGRLAQLIWDSLPEALHARIEAAPFFFLATSDRQGDCDCSFKGGGPGLVKVLSTKQLAFPHFGARVKGNGTYTSLGNLLDNPRASLLFIDFTDGARLRINGRTSIRKDASLARQFPDAECLVVVDIERVAPSCPSHIPLMKPVARP